MFTKQHSPVQYSVQGSSCSAYSLEFIKNSTFPTVLSQSSVCTSHRWKKGQENHQPVTEQNDWGVCVEQKLLKEFLSTKEISKAADPPKIISAPVVFHPCFLKF